MMENSNNSNQTGAINALVCMRVSERGYCNRRPSRRVCRARATFFFPLLHNNKTDIETKIQKNFFSFSFTSNVRYGHGV